MLRFAVLRFAVLGFAVSAVMMTVLAPSAGADPLADAVEQYRPYVIDDIDHVLAGARELRDRIVANDIAGAQKAWINARTGWERSEVFTSGFVPQLDDAIDAWPDATKGFHAIEAKLFGARSSDVQSADMQSSGLQDETDTLILHLADLDRQIGEMKLTAQGLLNGVARLAYEVGDSKVDGGESRFSGTSLDDMRNNADGIELAYRILFASALEASDPKLAERARAQIARLKQLVTVGDLKLVDADALRKASEDLVVTLQIAGPKMDLNPPTLEETAQ
jgi:iron uptake system component EfeO